MRVGSLLIKSEFIKSIYNYNFAPDLVTNYNLGLMFPLEKRSLFRIIAELNLQPLNLHFLSIQQEFDQLRF